MSVAVVDPRTAHSVACSAIAGVKMTQCMQVKLIKKRYAKECEKFALHGRVKRFWLSFTGHAPQDPAVEIGWSRSELREAETHGNGWIDTAREIIKATERAEMLHIDVEDWATLLRYSQVEAKAL